MPVFFMDANFIFMQHLGNECEIILFKKYSSVDGIFYLRTKGSRLYKM